MATINGNTSWGIQPIDWNSSDMAGAFWEKRSNYIKSANDPLRYQVVWSKGGLTEAIEPSASNGTATQGDVVYIKFIVEVCMNTDDAATNGWEELTAITKTRDIANRKYDTDTAAPNHRFTIDVSQVVSDQLSYSLCPIGKGTWQDNLYGGMNGGHVMQDNVIANTGTMGDPVSWYNISKNGTFRRLRVRAQHYIINSDGELLKASGDLTSNVFTVINSVNQFEEDSVYYGDTNMGGFYYMSSHNSSSVYYYYAFFSRYNNYTNLSATPAPSKKPVRMDDAAEFLNFYFALADSKDIGGTDEDEVRAIGMKIETFTSDGTAENTFYLNDFESNFITEVNASSETIFSNAQWMMFTQNISPDYINSYATCKSYSSSSSTFPHWTTYTGSKITSSTAYYRVSIIRYSNHATTNHRRTSEYRYYTIDREDEKLPYSFVRFHWLNDLGATDSYTAKRYISEGYSISKDIVERKSGDRTWYQGQFNQGTELDDGMYISDTMRGGNLYKGGREVMSVNADKSLSVYTEPLNNEEAKWLAKMMLSPNVWVEMDTQATKIGEYMNDYLRPSTKEYIPVIITNSNVETVNQEQGLVSFNIEYTLSHKVVTQRN
jgi:hypothetical protein